MQERAGKTEVFQYDSIPKKLRTQIWFILTDGIGGMSEMDTWQQIHNDLAREIGVLDLYEALSGVPIPNFNSCFEKCKFFLLKTTLEHVWDLVELCFRFMKNRNVIFRNSNDKIFRNKLINEFNVRCRDHAVGYEYVNDKIIRVDSQYVHAEVVLPALNLLQHSQFDGASEEFLNAHKHLREGRNNEAVNAANNAFESTMKIICTIKKWKLKQNNSASDLVDILFKNKLIPDYLKRHFSKLAELLKSGAPTIRNKETAHGQGSKPVDVSHSLATYALHLTASNIVFLVSAMNDQEA